MSVVYDTAVFVAAERNDREVWADHRTRLQMGLIPRTTAPVVAQVSRSPRQAQLHRMLRGCEIVPFASEHAHEVGSLLGTTGTADVVDAHLIMIAARSSATILSSDVDDLRHLAAELPVPVRVQRI